MIGHGLMQPSVVLQSMAALLLIVLQGGVQLLVGGSRDEDSHTRSFGSSFELSSGSHFISKTKAEEKAYVLSEIRQHQKILEPSVVTAASEMTRLEAEKKTAQFDSKVLQLWSSMLSSVEVEGPTMMLSKEDLQKIYKSAKLQTEAKHLQAENAEPNTQQLINAINVSIQQKAQKLEQELTAKYQQVIPRDQSALQAAADERERLQARLKKAQFDLQVLSQWTALFGTSDGQKSAQTIKTLLISNTFLKQQFENLWRSLSGNMLARAPLPISLSDEEFASWLTNLETSFLGQAANAINAMPNVQLKSVEKFFAEGVKAKVLARVRENHPPYDQAMLEDAFTDPKLISELYVETCSAVADNFFKAMDSDGDGFLTWEEFHTWNWEALTNAGA